MIVALDNFGDVYLCLSQSNTNQFTFAEYIRHLVKCLDRDRPRWRSNTILQVDGASYHRTEMMEELYAKLKVPIMVSAPYSFDVSVAELFFSQFKRGEINPQCLGLTKSKCHHILTSLQSIFII
jgi:hypothetical protein